MTQDASSKKRVKVGVYKHKASNAVAIHAVGEEAQAVIWDQLDVLIKPVDGLFVAYGIQVNYAACAETVEKVKTNFVKGFQATVGARLREDNGIESLLAQAPSSVISEYAGAKLQNKLTMWSAYRLPVNQVAGMIRFMAVSDQPVQTAHAPA